MSNATSGIAVLLIGATAVWGGWEARSVRADLVEVQERLAQIEQRAEADVPAGSRGGRMARRSAGERPSRDEVRSRSRSRRGGGGDGAGELVLEEGSEAWEQVEGAVEKANERIRERKSESWGRVMIEAVRSEAADVVESQGLNASVVDEVVSIFETSMDTHRAIKEDLESGEIGYSEARDEFDAAKADSDDALVELLGEDGAEALQANLPFGRHRGGK